MVADDLPISADASLPEPEVDILPDVVLEQEDEEVPQLAEGKIYLGKTKNGKIIQCYRGPKFGHYIVEFADGGQIPQELGGEWTRMQFLKNALDVYLSK